MIKKILIVVAWAFLVLIVLILGLSMFIASMYLVVPFDLRKDLHLSEFPQTLTEWESSKAQRIELFQSEIYGAYPAPHLTWNITKEKLETPTNLMAEADVEEWDFATPDGKKIITALVIIPHSSTPVPAIISSNFCGNKQSAPQLNATKPRSAYPSFCESESKFSSLMETLVFGELVSEFPIEELLNNDIALILFYPGEVVADEAELAQVDLKYLSEITNTDVQGAISAWAWMHNELFFEVVKDPRINNQNIGHYGHSRNGKASLLAGVMNPDVAFVIAHQPGTAGTTPAVSGRGESVKEITKTYPYWFTPKFSTYSDKEDLLPVDQHELIALYAPRPLLISGAWIDKWSDPEGSFFAATKANAVYSLYGSEGMTALDISDFKPQDDIAFFMRNSFHGVRPSDWQAFIQFVHKHTK